MAVEEGVGAEEWEVVMVIDRRMGWVTSWTREKEEKNTKERHMTKRTATE